jgi:transglutaminase-like putative cysteine protease
MTRTALEAYYDKTGVCRDYTHLAVAFCRCEHSRTLAARATSAISASPPHGTMDFAAWFRVFLGGKWHTFDARNNTPRIGRVLIARGRDAATFLRISSTFRSGTLWWLRRVWTDEVRRGRRSPPRRRVDSSTTEERC